MSTCSELLRSALDAGIPHPAIRAYVEDVGLPYALEGIEDAYSGVWRKEEDFAFELAIETGMVSPRTDAGMYFDSESFARDLFMGDYTSAPAPGCMIYVFRNM